MKMKMSKSLMSAGLLTAVAVGSLAGVSAVNAASDSHKDSLIDKIVTETGADRSKVEAAFESHHEEMHAQKELKRSEHLQNLVDAGTITAEQKTALEAKFEDMHTQREALRDQDLTREEMHTQMQQYRSEFESWAKEQGLDLNAIRPEGEGFGPRGHGHFGSMHDDATDTEDTIN